MWPGRPAAWSRTSIARRRSSRCVGQERHRVEIALDRAVVADHLPGVVEPHAPIDADHAAPASASSGSSCGLPVAKLITGTPGVMPRMTCVHVRQHELAIVVDAEAADPGVEELHRLGAGGDLGVEIDDDRAGEPLISSCQAPASRYISVLVCR